MEHLNEVLQSYGALTVVAMSTTFPVSMVSWSIMGNAV